LKVGLNMVVAGASTCSWRGCLEYDALECRMSKTNLSNAVAGDSTYLGRGCPMDHALVCKEGY